MNMISLPSTYSRPYDELGVASEEPTDDTATILARMLAHWATFYDAENITAKEIVRDILDSNAVSASVAPMSRDECVAIAHVFGIEF